MFVANPRKRCDLFEFQTQCCFRQEMWWDKFPVREKITHRPQLGLSHQDSQKLQQKVGTEICFDLSLLVCNISKNVSAWPTASLQFFDWSASLLPATSKLFSQCLSSYASGSSFEFFPLTRRVTSGTANSHKSAPTRFAAGTIFFSKKEWRFSQ